MTTGTGSHVDLAAELRRVDDVVIVGFTGDVDAMSAPKLRDALVKVLAAGHLRIICDLTGVGFLDSTGLGVLVGRLKAVRMAEGELRLVVSSERLLRNFKITGLDTIFDINATVDDALSAMEARAA